MQAKKDLRNVRLYFSDIESIEIMNESERSHLFKRLEKGDMSAKDELIAGNLRLVRKIVRKYTNENNDNYLDYIQAGNIGLMTAVEKFDYKRNNKFYTYAIYWIREAIIRYMQNYERIVRIPVTTNETLLKISNAKEKIIKETGSCEDLNQVSRLTGIPLNKVVEYENLTFEIKSLNDFAYDDDGQSEEVINFVSDDSELSIQDNMIDQEFLEKCLNFVYSMKPNHQYVAINYYFAEILCIEKKTQEEIAEELGITQQWVSQMKKIVENKIKKFLLENHQFEVRSKIK